MINSDSYAKILGKHLRGYRLAKDFTQEELAQEAGVNDKYIGRIERGKHRPSYQTIDLFSYVLDFSQKRLSAAIWSEMPDDPPSE